MFNPKILNSKILLPVFVIPVWQGGFLIPRRGFGMTDRIQVKGRSGDSQTPFCNAGIPVRMPLLPIPKSTCHSERQRGIPYELKVLSDNQPPSQKFSYMNFSLFWRLRRAASRKSIVPVTSMILFLSVIIAQVVSFTS